MSSPNDDNSDDHRDDGRTLGAYQLVSQLAVGGMAEIYVARTRGLSGFEKLVALKLIHPNFGADPDFIQMLVDEAKLSVQLTHANIVQTFDLGRVDEQYYIAMELIDGVDLYKLLRRASEVDIDFPFEVAAFITAEVCAGLDYAHRKKDARGRPLEIVHRDVSPQNVLVSYEGEVKIVDFGIAKAARRAQQTAAGVIKGKYYYMSPEQAWGDPIDPRTDIFSAGILLYEMIIGQMLYLESDLDKLLEIVAPGGHPIAVDAAQGPAAALEGIVMRALKKRADDRWSSAAQMAQVLTEFQRGLAPDFNRARLAAFVKEVMGDDPTAERRDPRLVTAAAPAVSAAWRDDNSLLFKLSDLRPAPGSAPSPAPAATPRRADVATGVHPAIPSGRMRSDFDDGDATIVDPGASPAMLSTLEAGENESTRTAGPKLQLPVQNPSGSFNLMMDDPAIVDDRAAAGAPERNAPHLLDDEDAPTGSHPLSALVPAGLTPPSAANDDDDFPPLPRLPGVRQAKLTVPAVRARPHPTPVPPTNASNHPGGPLISDLTDADKTRPLPESRRRTPGLGTPSFADSSAEDPTRAARARPPSSQHGIVPDKGPPAHTPGPLSGGAKGGPKLGFDEPTRIPPAAPPPIDSGRWEPPSHLRDPSQSELPAFGSPLGRPEPRRRRRRRVWVIVLLALLGALAAAAYVTLGPGGLRGLWHSLDGRARLDIVSLPPGAEVRVDGAPVPGTTPIVLDTVDPRLPHHVRVSKSGFDVWESDVKFPATERQVRVQAVLVPIVGTLEISSTPPGAEAIVNGRIRGMTPARVEDLPPNEIVDIELRLRGYKAAHKSVTFAGKRTLVVSIPLEKAK